MGIVARNHESSTPSLPTIAAVLDVLIATATALRTRPDDQGDRELAVLANDLVAAGENLHRVAEQVAYLAGVPREQWP